MNRIFYWMADLPLSIHGFTLNDPNGDYNVYLNSNLSEEAKKKTILHELQHIADGDLELEDYVPDDFGKSK